MQLKEISETPLFYFQGNGFWFVYPDEPLGPSAGLGFMLLHEARYTPIPEFYNNVAHSNAKVCIFYYTG